MSAIGVKRKYGMGTDDEAVEKCKNQRATRVVLYPSNTAAAAAVILVPHKGEPTAAPHHTQPAAHRSQTAAAQPPPPPTSPRPTSTGRTGSQQGPEEQEEEEREGDEQQKQQQQQALALVAAATTRTPFERRVWALLCQIPRGRVSTYGALAAHMGSSPRAVGNALRRNPFAPAVPCHRVVATGGGLGGFKGKVARRDGEGITLREKRALLRREGVRLDAAGEKVLGTPWDGFVG